MLRHVEGLDIICNLVIVILLLDPFDIPSRLFSEACSLLLLFDIVFHFGGFMTNSGGIVVSDSSHAWT